MESITEIAVIKERIDQHDKILESISQDIKDIKDKLLSRPTWFITTIISLLLATIGFLVTKI